MNLKSKISSDKLKVEPMAGATKQPERRRAPRTTPGPDGSSSARRHFVSLFDLSAVEARTLIDQTIELKRNQRDARQSARLQGRTLALVFEKPSLRTRLSFQAAIARLGGNSIFLPGSDVGLGVRESVPDFARVISQYVDVLAIRTFSQSIIEELARYASIPIINALSDSSHPCQAMADMVTMLEHLGSLTGKKLVFVGDGNNVARSLAVASAYLGVEFVLTAPPSYEFPAEFRERFKARFPSVPLKVEHDAKKAVKGADVIYTDVWASMGQEQEADQRRRIFALTRSTRP